MSLYHSKTARKIAEYVLLTAATLIMTVGIYVFKFPNHFSFGGVTGVAVVLAAIFNMSASAFTFIINMALLALGFLLLGKKAGLKTAYASVLMSVALWVMEKVFPMQRPLTMEPVLELIYAIVLPALGSAILFNMEASGGGTDIIAMILKKYTHINIGSALFWVDCLIVILSCFVFDIKTGLFSFCGLMAKSLVIDGVIENINLSKYFTIICDNPEPICDFITNELQRSATVYAAQGAYSRRDKTIILAVMKRSQAIRLRNYVKRTQPLSFIMITNSSEIIGKGFRGFN